MSRIATNGPRDGADGQLGFEGELVDANAPTIEAALDAFAIDLDVPASGDLGVHVLSIEQGRVGGMVHALRCSAGAVQEVGGSDTEVSERSVDA